MHDEISAQAPEYRIAEPSIAVVTQFESREQKLAAHRSKGPAPAASSAAAFPTLGGGGGVGGGGGGITWGGGVKIAKKKAKPKVEFDSSRCLSGVLTTFFMAAFDFRMPWRRAYQTACRMAVRVGSDARLNAGCDPSLLRGFLP